jgi:hypothetical protein
VERDAAAEAAFCRDYLAECERDPARCREAELPPVATVADLAGKNAYDIALRDFLRAKKYRETGWRGDAQWRLSGPYVGELGEGESYGVHPGVRIWYSPAILKWMCGGRQGEPDDGAMIVKEMLDLGSAETFETLGIVAGSACMVIDPAADPQPGSWTVMVRHSGATHDGWYWANPAGSGEGNPRIVDRSAVTAPDAVPATHEPKMSPTGDVFGADGHVASVVTPYSQFGAYCVNCHASASSYSTFVSLENLLGPGLRYRHFSAAAEPPPATAAAVHDDAHDAWGLTRPADPDSVRREFTQMFGDLGPQTYADALPLRLPAQTFDHELAPPKTERAQFLTSDQCVGCHDATVSNDSRPHMIIDAPGKPGGKVNVSPYGEWRSSPMGLAGRDPIFFAQLQSETNHLPAAKDCIEDLCLHCHGAMGQRTLAKDTKRDDAKCKDLFANPPPDGVPFGEPFALDTVTRWQTADDPAGQGARYGGLARDGISCTVCHRITGAALGEERANTGNFVTAVAKEMFGPYADEDIVAKPMENALGYTPKKGEQLTDSALCGSCHNVLLPVFDAGGRVASHRFEGKTLTHRYEQSTNLEWENSVYGPDRAKFQSCQACHMPTSFPGHGELKGMKIANVESSEFAPTTERLGDHEIRLTPRDHYARHALHGINLFLNQMFQQFPLLLGIRQIDYMGSIGKDLQPSLVTSAQSMTHLARNETAEIAIESLAIDAATGMLVADVRVTNKAGHFLPSGVGFRRVFVELVVRDEAGEMLWASGRTNDLGFILDGITDDVLPGEYGDAKASARQPHHATITRGNQAQIYQELTVDSEGALTTNFLRRFREVKDNRLRPEGYDPAFFTDEKRFGSPYVRELAEPIGATRDDPHYTDPDKTGADALTYRVRLSPADAARVTTVTVRLLSQSIPPFYLQQRFADAGQGLAEHDQISRLYYLTSHLRTDEDTPIDGWKVVLVEDCKRASGQPCE